MENLTDDRYTLDDGSTRRIPEPSSTHTHLPNALHAGDRFLLRAGGWVQVEEIHLGCLASLHPVVFVDYYYRDGDRHGRETVAFAQFVENFRGE